jgi:Zn-dependent protease with chaperone function
MQTDSKTTRPINLEPLVYPKEKVYFAVGVVLTVAIYFAIARIILSAAGAATTLITYIVALLLISFLMRGLFIGHVRGNGIRVSQRQFPELMAMADRHAKRLGMDNTPDVFVLQSGGVLNAFATRFLGRNFVVLYSDVLALATEKGERAVGFVLGHEMGHVQRKHMTWRAVLFPAMAIPFFGSAYSRACEYTCDRFGSALEPDAGVDGLLVLAAGRDLYHQVNTNEFSRQRETETGFFVSFAEKIASHPHLTKRVAALSAIAERQPKLATPIPAPVASAL